MKDTSATVIRALVLPERCPPEWPSLGRIRQGLRGRGLGMPAVQAENVVLPVLNVALFADPPRTWPVALLTRDGRGNTAPLTS